MSFIKKDTFTSSKESIYDPLSSLTNQYILFDVESTTPPLKRGFVKLASFGIRLFPNKFWTAPISAPSVLLT